MLEYQIRKCFKVICQPLGSCEKSGYIMFQVDHCLRITVYTAVTWMIPAPQIIALSSQQMAYHEDCNFKLQNSSRDANAKRIANMQV